jgi:hypothetical protein
MLATIPGGNIACGCTIAPLLRRGCRAAAAAAAAWPELEPTNMWCGGIDMSSFQDVGSSDGVEDDNDDNDDAEEARIPRCGLFQGTAPFTGARPGTATTCAMLLRTFAAVAIICSAFLFFFCLSFFLAISIVPVSRY